MKKMLFCLMAFGMASYAQAQDNTKITNNNIDSLLPRFCIDADFYGGAQGQTLSTINYASAFTNPLNANISSPKYMNGATAGFDLQGGYFFGKKRHWGVGTGLIYLRQTGNIAMDDYHIEYLSTDYNNDIFRQEVTADQAIKENVTMTNINIPLVLKYKHQLGRRFGFAADAGVVFNVQAQNAYSTNASFDYEAIYKYNAQGMLVYDASPVPDQAHDWLITKAEYTRLDPSNVVEDFNKMRAEGYNVGLNVKPNSTKGTVNYTTGNVGLLLKPSITYRISQAFYIDLGVYYMYQTFKNNAQNSYQLTDKIGSYSSLMNSVTTAVQNSYGGNVGVRFYIGRKDRDHDGVSDRKDKCPDVFGLAKFDGCPDTDGDGIPDKDDRCPTVAGLMQFHGCPDTDGDGIPDIDDKCPTQAGLAKFNGCPDTDGDGIPDATDKCPTVAGPASNGGCPIIDTAMPAPVVEEQIAISTPILFDENKITIHKLSIPVLKEAVEKLNKNASAYIYIDGYTDAIGSNAYNEILSVKRANAVKEYLVAMGGDPKRIETRGHGKKDPVASNKTRAGRMQNRRAVMSIKEKN